MLPSSHPTCVRSFLEFAIHITNIRVTLLTASTLKSKGMVNFRNKLCYFHDNGFYTNHGCFCVRSFLTRHSLPWLKTSRHTISRINPHNYLIEAISSVSTHSVSSRTARAMSTNFGWNFSTYLILCVFIHAQPHPISFIRTNSLTKKKYYIFQIYRYCLVIIH